MVNIQGNMIVFGVLEVVIECSYGENWLILIYLEGGLVVIGEIKCYCKGVYKIYEIFGWDVIFVVINFGLCWNQDDWYKIQGLAVIEFFDFIFVDLL